VRALTLTALLSCSLPGVGLLLASQAEAAESNLCPDNNPNWVQITVDAPASPQLASNLLEYLQAELAPHQIAACTASPRAQGPPLANIHIVSSSSNQVGIEVRVEDSVTNKRVTRQLDLRGIPPDAHAMTIALGAAELLRASWAEVKLRGSRVAQGPVPSSVRQTVEEETAPPPARAMMGVHLAGEDFSRGLKQGGVDGTASLRLIDAWQFALRLGARQVLAVSASDGVVRGNSWLAGAGLVFRVTRPESRASLGFTGHIDALRLQFFAEPRPGVTSDARAGTGFICGLGVLGALRLNQLTEVQAQLDAGGVLKGVRAMDGSQSVMAMNGAWLGASVGIGVRIW
jgi:hypothetical protein